MKPSLFLPDVLGAAAERGLPDPIAASSVSDDLQTRFGPTGQAGRHTSVIAEPYARVPIAIVGIGCGWPGAITNPDGLSKPLLSY